MSESLLLYCMALEDVDTFLASQVSQLSVADAVHFKAWRFESTWADILKHLLFQMHESLWNKNLTLAFSHRKVNQLIESAQCFLSS